MGEGTHPCSWTEWHCQANSYGSITFPCTGYVVVWIIGLLRTVASEESPGLPCLRVIVKWSYLLTWGRVSEGKDHSTVSRRCIISVDIWQGRSPCNGKQTQRLKIESRNVGQVNRTQLDFHSQITVVESNACCDKAYVNVEHFLLDFFGQIWPLDTLRHLSQAQFWPFLKYFNFGHFLSEFFCQIWTQDTLRHIAWPILAIFEIFQFWTLPFGIFLSNLDIRHLKTYRRTYFGHFWNNYILQSILMNQILITQAFVLNVIVFV